MSCGCCNQTPCCCSGQLAPAICCTPTTESVTYEFENQNLIGVGVFNGETDNLVGFRGIASDTLALTVTLDVANNAIIISFNDELLIDDIPTATETIRGIAEVATQGETNAGALDDKIVTPLKLFSMLATETQRGILEIATQAEVTTGTNDTNAVTPLKLATFAGSQFTTRVFADAVARNAAVPAFEGQLGFQIDTNEFIISTGVIAGTFTNNVVVGTLAATSAGTAGAPAIFRSGDPDTGIYWVGSNVLGISAAANLAAQFSQTEVQFHVTAFFEDGTASDPSIAFSSDSQTGFYLAAPEQIGVSIAGTQFAWIDAFNLVLNGISLRVPATITAGGTTGAQVINKMSGSVNFAAAASSLVVTNNLVTANSVVMATVATNDATMKTVSVTQGAGSFTITANAAATGETRVNFLLTNPT